MVLHPEITVPYLSPWQHLLQVIFSIASWLEFRQTDVEFWWFWNQVALTCFEISNGSCMKGAIQLFLAGMLSTYLRTVWHEILNLRTRKYLDNSILHIPNCAFSHFETCCAVPYVKKNHVEKNMYWYYWMISTSYHKKFRPCWNAALHCTELKSWNKNWYCHWGQ